MRDNQRGAVLGNTGDRVLDEYLGFGGLIENDDRRIVGNRPREGKQLALGITQKEMSVSRTSIISIAPMMPIIKKTS